MTSQLTVIMNELIICHGKVFSAPGIFLLLVRTQEIYLSNFIAATSPLYKKIGILSTKNRGAIEILPNESLCMINNKSI